MTDPLHHNLIGTPPYSINGFRFVVTNLNTLEDVTARPLVRFYLPDGPSGGPGTLIKASTYNPIVFTAGVVGTIKTSTTFPLESSAIWAGIAFDNNSGTTGATAEQLDNLALGIFSPAEVGTSTDQYFVTTNAGSFASDDPAGTLTNFGGSPPADFGWEILTAQDVNLSITKTDGVDTAFPGGGLTYTIAASNAGPQAVFDARVVDIFPETLTCSWTCAGSIGNICAASGTGDINDQTVDLAVDGSVTYTANCDVSPTATGTLENRQHSHGYRDVDPNQYSDGDRHADGDTDQHSHRYGDTDIDSDQHSDGHADGDTDQYTNGYADVDPDQRDCAALGAGDPDTLRHRSRHPGAAPTRARAALPDALATRRLAGR